MAHHAQLGSSLQVIIAETIDNGEVGLDLEALKLELGMADDQFIYFKVQKNDFQHGQTRNLLAKQANAKYLIFSTQDTFPLPILNLARSTRLLDNLELDGLTVRHQSPYGAFKNVFEGLFAGIQQDSYADKEMVTALFWSNNYSIYRALTIEKIGFPNLNFAEDYYWAILAKSAGCNLYLDNFQAISHLNIDTYASAYNRGRQEALGHFEGRRLVCMQDNKNQIPLLSALTRFAQILKSDFYQFREYFEISRYKFYFTDSVRTFAFHRYSNLLKRGRF